MATYKTQKYKNYWRINQNIRSPQVRLLDSNGKQLGIFSSSEALKKAQEQRLDLVEIASKASPPVAKIISFAKFKYREEKRLKEAQKHARRGVEQKEVWLTPFIGDNDYQTRLEKIKEFLQDGHKTRVVVKFTGPQMAHREFGYVLVKRVNKDLEEISAVDVAPKFLGRQLITTLRPEKSLATKENEKAEENKVQDTKVGSETN